MKSVNQLLRVKVCGTSPIGLKGLKLMENENSTAVRNISQQSVPLRKIG